jgi:hypothetical protein
VKIILSKLTVFSLFFIFLGLIWQFLPSNDRPPDKSLYPIIGDAEKLKNTYERWKARATENGEESKITLGLGYDKALSSQLTRARGEASLDLINGAFSVRVSGLNDKENYDVWLIDNIEGAKKSVKPEKGDVIVKIGTLKNDHGSLQLYKQIDPKQFRGFKVDLVAVTVAGKEPIHSGLIFGTPSLFQRLYYSELRGEFGTLNNEPDNPSNKSLLSTPFSLLIPEPAIAAGHGLNHIVAEGEDLFFNETFGGNGRTCGTCHPLENNLTIDPDFIATLPPDDPLFVAETNPDLASLENPVLMRKFGLILENVDGFDRPGVMRGVPHVLALSTSLEQDTTTTNPPADMTGWSGDGAPAPGALRNFATGAVIQHFPRTLNRVPGEDFILPTDSELDALEAFLLSLGRQADPNLGSTLAPGLVLTDPSAQNGLVVFRDGNNPTNRPNKAGGKCQTCHVNAGASSLLAAPNSNGVVLINRNFNIGAEDFPHPADTDPDTKNEPRPRDGGFGQEPNPAGGFGNGEFNSTPLVEAADTAPFFHNNVIDSVEDAVAFYKSKAFNDNPNNDRPIEAEIKLSNKEVDDVANFMRVINALENIRSSKQFEERAKNGTSTNAVKILNVALYDIEDAIQVLDEKGLHPDAVADLEEAVDLTQAAVEADSNRARKSLIDDAIEELDSAKDEMCIPGSDNVLCPL